MIRPDPRQSVGADLRALGATLVGGAVVMAIIGSPLRAKALSVGALGALLWRHGWKATHGQPANPSELLAIVSGQAPVPVSGTIIEGEARAV